MTDIRPEDYRYFLDMVMNFSDDGYIIVDKDGVVLDINDRYRRMFNKPKEDIVGKHVYNLIHNSSLPKLIAEKRTEYQVVDKWLDTDIDTEAYPDYARQIALISRGCVMDDKGNPLGAIAQVKLGADTVSSAERTLSVISELEFYRDEYRKNDTNQMGFSSVVGNSEKILHTKLLGYKAAASDFEVLLTGESGTGKSIFARAIHNASSRKEKPMVVVNCAAIPGELLESELFGYEEGSFTGAKKGGKIGKFEMANGGTIFLDEIGDMPLNMQAKILHVLQEHEIVRVGGTEPISLDVRVISATNRDLNEMIRQGTFREDLYYRINVINIHMPALRERRGDIIELASRFLADLNKRYNKKLFLSEQVKTSFLQYKWLGNVRELENVVKSAYATCDGLLIDISDLPAKIISTAILKEPGQKLSTLVDNYERGIIVNTLRFCKGNAIEAAKELGVSRSGLYKKIKKHNIELSSSQIRIFKEEGFL